MFKQQIRFLLAIGILLLIQTVAWSAPSAELWERWTIHDADSSVSIDHTAWQNFLNSYRSIDPTDNIAKIDYTAVSSDDRDRLSEYISKLESVDVDALSRDEQFAYWVNLYNAATVRLILDEYPVSSIRRISRPWDRKLLLVMDEEISLNDIEHRILRPIWKDPRIHFVVNCASIGCPDIPASALTASNYSEQLANSAREYINHPRGLRIDGGRLYLSSIFDWYSGDFGSSISERLGFIARYLDSQGNSELLEFNPGQIRYEYDWSLNEAE